MRTRVSRAPRGDGGSGSGSAPRSRAGPLAPSGRRRLSSGSGAERNGAADGMPREIITLQLGQCGNQSEWAPESGGRARTGQRGPGGAGMLWGTWAGPGGGGGAWRRGSGLEAGVADRHPRSWVRVLEAALRRARHQPRGHRGRVRH